MARTVTLTKPLTTANGAVTELNLRDLNAGDMADMRVSPINYTAEYEGVGAARIQKTRAEVRYDIALRYLARLSGLDEITLRGMRSKDFDAAVNELSEMWTEAGE